MFFNIPKEKLTQRHGKMTTYVMGYGRMWTLRGRRLHYHLINYICNTFHP